MGTVYKLEPGTILSQIERLWLGRYLEGGRKSRGHQADSLSRLHLVCSWRRELWVLRGEGGLRRSCWGRCRFESLVGRACGVLDRQRKERARRWAERGQWKRERDMAYHQSTVLSTSLRTVITPPFSKLKSSGSVPVNEKMARAWCVSRFSACSAEFLYNLFL